MGGQPVPREPVSMTPIAVVRNTVFDPKPDGWETLAALHEADPDLPVLMASGFGSDQEARERGALGLIAKPYSATELRAIVASMIEQHGR